MACTPTCIKVHNQTINWLCSVQYVVTLTKYDRPCFCGGVLWAHQRMSGLKAWPLSLLLQQLHRCCTTCLSVSVSCWGLRTRPKVMCMMLLCLLDAPAVCKHYRSWTAAAHVCGGTKSKHTLQETVDHHIDVAGPGGRETALTWAQLSCSPERTACNKLCECAILRGHVLVGALAFVTPPSL